jgi:hypothetical protein
MCKVETVCVQLAAEAPDLDPWFIHRVAELVVESR